MITFKQYYLLNEITEDTILYHRSPEDFQEGQILDPKEKFKGDHPYLKRPIEVKLEEYRQEHAPNAPSRMNCVFCSTVPRAAFVGRGKLYEVKPIGNFHITMAYYINQIGNRYEEVSYSELEGNIGSWPEREHYDTEKDYLEARKRYTDEQDEYKWKINAYHLIDLFAKYWGVNKETQIDAYKVDPKWIEVLCDKVYVVKAVEDNDDVLRTNDKIEITRDLVNVSFYGYKKDRNTQLSEEEMKRVYDNFEVKKGKYAGHDITIPKGTKGTITTSMPGHSKIRAYKDEDGGSVGTRGKSYHRLYFQPDGFDFIIDIARAIYDNGFVSPSNFVKKI